MLLALVLTSWVGFSRLVRGEVRKVKQEAFIDGLRSIGAGNGRILFLHIAPNLLSSILILSLIHIFARQIGGTVDHFVEMMNEEALALGMTGTHFVNPHGLHDGSHYTTAYDVYLMLNEAFRYSAFTDAIQMNICLLYTSYKVFFDEDIKVPMILVAVSDLGYNLLFYVIQFAFRMRFDFGAYFQHTILPEMVYTVLLTIIFYRIYFFINKTLVEDELEGQQRCV